MQSIAVFTNYFTTRVFTNPPKNLTCVSVDLTVDKRLAFVSLPPLDILREKLQGINPRQERVLDHILHTRLSEL